MRCILVRGPKPVHAIDTCMCEPLFRPLKCILQLAAPLGNGKAQSTDQVCKAGARQWRIDLNSRINERVDSSAALSCIGGSRSVLVNGVNADSALPPYNAQHAAIMHGRQQMSGSARQPAPVIPDCAVLKIVIYFARVCLTALSHKSQHELCAFLARSRPFSRSFG